MTPMSNNLRNAQDDLIRRRPNGHGRTTPIAAMIPEAIKATPAVPETTPPAPTRVYQVKPLDAFTYDHLPNPEHKARLRLSLDKARAWLAAAPSQSGLSFVLTGSVGTGKTTIAENLMEPFKRTVGIVPEPADMAYLDGLRRSWAAATDPDRRVWLAQEISEYERMLTPRLLSGGVLLEATALMRLVADQSPLSYALDRYDVIVVDDVGREDFSTATYTPSVEDTRPVRQNRYGRFLDYCYRAHKHVIITSNTPLNDGGGVNAAFVDIFGDRGFDRLYQMAKGYMVDMTGLPSYRPYAVEGV